MAMRLGCGSLGSALHTRFAKKMGFSYKIRLCFSSMEQQIYKELLFLLYFRKIKIIRLIMLRFSLFFT